MSEAKKLAVDTGLPKTPRCPKCGSDMVTRTGSMGDFWGCIKYPACKGTRNTRKTAPLPTETDCRLAVFRLEAGLRFVAEMGGLRNAFDCLKAVASLLRADPPASSDE